jgi:peptidoglycan hydrolase CwlO-like protein
LTQTYIIASACFAAGLLIGLIILLLVRNRLKKELKSTQGFLEIEKLKKDTLKKENKTLSDLRDMNEMELIKKLQDAKGLIKTMDEDILLLQKSNEETEAQLQITQPELHAIKLKLIEAQNTIARYKGQIGK